LPIGIYRTTRMKITHSKFMDMKFEKIGDVVKLMEERSRRHCEQKYGRRCLIETDL
jgi:hypothetical protein